MFLWSPNRFPRRSPSLFGLKSGTVTATVLSEGLLQFNGDTGEITLLGGTTYGRTSGGYVQDYAGTYTLIAEGYPRIQGARYSGNTPYYTLADGTPLHPMRGHNGSTFLDTYPVWTANTVYAANARVIPTSGSGTAGGDGYWYYASTGGTSHATTEPTWAAGPVSDGTAAWTRGGYYRIGGYLHEQQVTNNINGGSVQAYQNIDEATFVSRVIVAPGGTPSATELGEGALTAVHDAYVASQLSGSANNKCISLFVKQPATSPVNIVSVNIATGGLGDGFGVKFDFRTQTTSAITFGTGVCSEHGAIPDENGWYRLWAVGKQTAGGALYNSLSLYDDSGALSYTGTNRTCYFWQADYIENASHVTSPVVSTASGAVTRAADTLTLPASVFSNTAGTLVADVQHALWSAAAGQVLGDGTEYVLGLATDVSGAKAYDGTNTVSGPAGTPAGVMRQAVRWASTALQLAANGTAETAGTYDESFNLSSLVIGSSFNGLIKNFRIYRSDQGADAALAALSAKETS